MTIMLVCEDPRTLKDAAALLVELQPDAEVLQFTDSLAALAEARKRPVDVALLAADMPELDGLDLGQYLKDLHPAVNLVFLDPDDAKALDTVGHVEAEPLSRRRSRHLLRRYGLRTDRLRDGPSCHPRRLSLQVAGRGCRYYIKRGGMVVRCQYDFARRRLPTRRTGGHDGEARVAV